MRTSLAILVPLLICALSGCETSATSDTRQTPITALAPAEDDIARALSFESYVTDDYLLAKPVPACHRLGPAGGRLVSALLPDSSWYTIKVFPRPGGSVLQTIQVVRGHGAIEDMRVVLFEGRNLDAYVGATSTRAPQHLDLNSAIGSRVRELGRRAFTINCELRR